LRIDEALERLLQVVRDRNDCDSDEASMSPVDPVGAGLLERSSASARGLGGSAAYVARHPGHEPVHRLGRLFPDGWCACCVRCLTRESDGTGTPC
jgi:hypothetical protein